MPAVMHPMLNTAVKAARRAGTIINRASQNLDILAVTEKTANDYVSEVDRAAAYCAGRPQGTGERIDWLRRELVPPVTPVVPEGLDVCALPYAELRRAYGLATASARFGPERPAAARMRPQFGSAP